MTDFETKAREVLLSLSRGTALRNYVELGRDEPVVSAIAAAFAEAVAAEREALAQSRAALGAAREEIQWWVNDHGCCAGHESEALAKIDAALQ